MSLLNVPFTNKRVRYGRVMLLTALCLHVFSVSGSQASASLIAQERNTNVDIQVISIERSEHTTQMLLELHNPTDESESAFGLTDPAYDALGRIVANDLSGVHLLDEAEGVEYLPFREIRATGDAEDKVCVCSRMGSIDAGETLTVWWRSAPLPDTVDRVTVLAPDGAELATDVEVTR